MDIGKEIKHYRQELGLTQKELAIKAGITPIYLSQIERGVYQPSENVINKLKGVLHISEEHLQPKLCRMRKENMRAILTKEQLMYEYNRYHPILVEVLTPDLSTESKIYPAILDISIFPPHELVAYYGTDKELLHIESYGREWVAYHYYEAFIDEERNQIK